MTVTSGTANIMVQSSDFVPQVEVLDAAGNVVAVDSNDWWSGWARCH